MSNPSPYTVRERVVTGVACMAAALATRFLPFGDPETTGRSALAEMSNRVAEGVVSEWTLVCRNAAPPFDSVDSAEIRWQPRTEPLASPGSRRNSNPGLELDVDARFAVFDALLAESERLELRAQTAPGQPDPNGASAALDVVLEALAKPCDASRKSVGSLRVIQLAVRASRLDIARERWSLVSSELHGDEAVGDTSALLASGLAVMPALAGDERESACTRLVDAWTSGALTLPGDAPHWVHDHDAKTITLARDPRRVALSDRLLESCASPKRQSALAEHDRDEESEALRLLLGDLPSRAHDELWHLQPALDALFEWRRSGNGCVGAFVEREAAEARIQSLAHDRGLLADGFALDFRGDRDDLGAIVRPRVELAEAALAFTLRHPDPVALARSASRRTTWLRAGLAGLAAAVMGMGLSTLRAFRRERKLAEARTAFIANVSHELRTPLASILLMAENLESGRAGANETRYHTLIRREALRLRRLVDDVLDFSRMERGKRFELRVEDVNLVVWFESLRTELAAFAEQSSASVECTHGELPERAAFDPEALRRGVFNLVDNALRHSGTKAASVRVDSQTDMLLITVADHGRGIPTAQRSEIFEPFARLPRTDGAPGAGLGLAIVREIVESYGGTISVRDPDQGPGTVFEIRIPLESPTTKASSS
jgi:signal transduction histidine kinase